MTGFFPRASTDVLLIVLNKTVNFFDYGQKWARIIKFAISKNNLPMSLLNNNNKKDKKKNQQKNNPGFPSPKGKTNSKAISKNTKLTGGSQRGS
jgi:hypothetical protein